MSDKTNNHGKKIADATIAVSGGLVAIIFSAQFLNIPKNPWIAALFLVVGIGAIVWAQYQWRKL